MSYTPRRALITGASSGIGAAFARAFAARGADVVLVARRADRLDSLAAELGSAHGVEARTLVLDLAQPGVGAILAERLGPAAPIDTVINNAGFGTRSPLAREDPALIEREIAVDVTALVSITRAFLPPMIERGRGAIINVASTASYQPVPGMAVYSASKAFVRTFTEAVWHEARPAGVKVLSLSPGPTRTEFFDVVGTEDAAVGAFQTAEQVVNTALRALDKRSTPPSAISGAANRLSAASVRLVPRRLVLDIAARAVAGPAHR